MKALVIGGNGFIGSHVVDHLLGSGAHVRVYSRRPEMYRAPLSDVEYVAGDLMDVGTVPEVFAGIDVVVHLASATVPSTSSLDPEKDVNTNLVGTLRLLEVMRETRIRRLVYLSSGGTVYGVPETEVVCESHPLRPISAYGVVKVAIENFLYSEHKTHGLEPVVIRPGNAYGPRETNLGLQGIIGTHLVRIARGEPIEIWGDGSAVRDFIYVEDLARLCALAADSSVVGSFNAGSGVGVSIAGVVDTIRSVVPGDPEPVLRPAPAYDVPRIVLDSGRALREFGWQPQTPLEQGIAHTWEWVRARVGAATAEECSRQ